MSFENIIVEIEPNGVAHLSMNRVDKHNALNAALINELSTALKELEANQDIRAIWLKSNAKHFCAGADLNGMKQSADFTPEENYEDALQLGNLLHTLYYLRKPTVVSVHGACFGGAIGLMACCDIAICANTAKFCFSEAKLGLVPAMISPYVMAAMGLRNAKAHFLSCEIFDGPKAYEMGLCYDVVSEEGLNERTQTVIDHLVKNSPNAMEQVGRLISEVYAKPIDKNLCEATAKIIADIRATDEGKEGLSAFLEKRNPNWIKD